MVLYCDGQVRLSREKLAFIRKHAAENGYVINDIKTPMQYLEATVKIMDEQTFSEIEAIVIAFMKERNIPFDDPSAPETSKDV